jgi:hypothetical protein
MTIKWRGIPAVPPIDAAQSVFLGAVKENLETLRDSIGTLQSDVETAAESSFVAVSVYMSRPTATVFDSAEGASGSFSDINGQITVFAGPDNVTALAKFKVVEDGLTGTVNTADNTPVANQPVGYYEVTSLSGTTGSLIITVTYDGVDYERVFTVSRVTSGYEIVTSLPTTNLFEGRLVFLKTDNKLYRYTGSTWTAAVDATDVTGQLTDAQLASIAAAKVSGQLTDAQLASISAAKLTGQITGTQITDGAISTPKLAAGSVTSNEIAANTIAAGNIAAGAITTPKLAAGAVTSNEIAAGTIVAGNIAASTITGTQIAAGTITANKIASNTITANQIQAGTITSAELATTTLITTSAQIGNAVISAANIGSINASTITTGTLNTSRLNIDGITLWNNGGTLGISDSGVSTNKIAGNAVSRVSAANGTGSTSISGVAPAYVVLQSVTFTTSGGVLLIDSSFGYLAQAIATGTVGIVAWIQVVGGGLGTQFHEASSWATAGGAGAGQKRGTMSIKTSGTLGAGTYTVELRAGLANSNSQAATLTTDRFLSVTELKR